MLGIAERLESVGRVVKRVAAVAVCAFLAYHFLVMLVAMDLRGL